MIKNISAALVGLFLLASSAHAYVSSETSSVARTMGAVSFSEVKFTTGNSALTAEQKKDISSAISNARQKGEIEKVKVLAWADKEYPQRNTKYDKADIDLASNRLQDIKNYLKDSLDISTVHTFNMSERPSKVQEILNTSDEKVKKHVEGDGTDQKTIDQTGAFGLRGQSSKALILVFLKK